MHGKLYNIKQPCIYTHTKIRVHFGQETFAFRANDVKQNKTNENKMMKKEQVASADADDDDAVCSTRGFVVSVSHIFVILLNIRYMISGACVCVCKVAGRIDAKCFVINYADARVGN